jgi:hypothetical protein
MSSRNGDKSRHHRMRKQKIARRLAVQQLREKLAAGAEAPAVTPNTKPSAS